MPELPEVEACRRNLVRWTAGCRVAAVQVPDPGAVRATRSTSPADALPDGVARVQGVVGQRTVALRRRGKRIAWQLDSAAWLLHLGMTGRWVRRGGGALPRFARLGVTLDDGHTLWFCDSRRFGCVAPVEASEIGEHLADGLGPDALDTPWTGAMLAAHMRTTSAVKVALMDQARLAGVGNIQAVEALFRAGIDPRASCRALAPADWDRLAQALPVQLRATLADAEGDEIAYMTDGAVPNPFSVYGRPGQPCQVCGTPLSQGRQAGRSSFWCTRCQPSGAPRV